MKRLLLGPHAVAEAVRAAPDRVAVIYAAEGAHDRALEQLARERRVRLELRSRTELDALAKGQRHQGLVAVTGDYAYLPLEQLLAGTAPHPLLIALDQVTDPHNFGAIVRSAVALGAAGVITLKDRAAPVTAAVVRAAAGATELAKIARVTNLARCLQELRAAGFQVVGLAAEAPLELSALGAIPAAGRLLVVGSEGAGLRRLVREQCDALARIDLPGPLSSLNASVAAGIAIYESMRVR